MSVAATWSGVGSLMVGIQMAQNFGILPFLLWAFGNTTACVVFGLFAPAIPKLRDVFSSKIMRFAAGIICMFQVWVNLNGIQAVFITTPLTGAFGTAAAYLAALYWDSEMFRHSSKKRRELEDKKDYKAEVYKLLRDPLKNFQTKGGLENAQRIIQALIKYGPIISGKAYKAVYDCLVGGDPKQRTLRAIITQINCGYSKANK